MKTLAALMLVPALTVTQVQPAAKTDEHPKVVITEAQYMAILSTFDRMEREKNEATDAAIRWYNEARDCKSRVAI